MSEPTEMRALDLNLTALRKMRDKAWADYCEINQRIYAAERADHCEFERLVREADERVRRQKNYSF
jgi:hypothetical protein